MFYSFHQVQYLSLKILKANPTTSVLHDSPFFHLFKVPVCGMGNALFPVNWNKLWIALALFVVTWIALNNVIFKTCLLVCWKHLKRNFFSGFVSPAAFWFSCFIFSINRDVSKKISSVKAEESPLFLRRTSISFLNHHSHLQEWSHSLLQVMFSSVFNLPSNVRMSACEKLQLYPLKAF